MKTNSKDMTTKPKPAKGLKPRVMWVNPGDYESSAQWINAHAKKNTDERHAAILPIVTLDASDAGREALAHAIHCAIIAEGITDRGGERLTAPIMKALGYRPAGAKKGKTKL